MKHNFKISFNLFYASSGKNFPHHWLIPINDFVRKTVYNSADNYEPTPSREFYYTSQFSWPQRIQGKPPIDNADCFSIQFNRVSSMDAP